MNEALQQLLNNATREVVDLRMQLDKVKKELAYYQRLAQEDFEILARRAEIRSTHDPIYRALRTVLSGVGPALSPKSFYALAEISPPIGDEDLEELTQKVHAVAEELGLDCGSRQMLKEDLGKPESLGTFIQLRIEDEGVEDW